jgi:hypothetical protein
MTLFWQAGLPCADRNRKGSFRHLSAIEKEMASTAGGTTVPATLTGRQKRGPAFARPPIRPDQTDRETDA